MGKYKKPTRFSIKSYAIIFKNVCVTIGVYSLSNTISGIEYGGN